LINLGAGRPRAWQDERPTPLETENSCTAFWNGEAGMFSLKNKMRLTYALVLLCFVAMGALAIYRLALVSSESNQMSTVWTPRTRIAQEMHAVAGQYRISEAMRILSTSPAMAEHANRELKDNADAFASKVAAYRGLLQKGESTAPIDDLLFGS